MAKRKRYDDEFRATAVLMLQSAGYPDKEGALTRVSNHLGVALSTLSGWYNGTSNPPPSKIRNKKKLDLLKVIRGELSSIFGDMDDAREHASYRDLSWAAGVLIDKVLLLQGEPTSRIEMGGIDTIEIVKDYGNLKD